MIFFAWLAVARPVIDEADELRHRIERFAATRTGPQWRRVFRHGPGWGLFAAAPDSGGWHWDLLAEDDHLTALSTAPPVGLDADQVVSGPLALGRATLDGAGPDRSVVPPLGVLALDRTAGRFALAQDWLGMARLFEYASPGLLTFSTSPVMPPYVLGHRLVPDEDGWARFLGGGIFGGSSTPVRGVQRLTAGALRTGQRLGDGTWRVVPSRGVSFDDIVAERPATAESSLDTTATGLRRAGAGLAALWPDDVTLGLSGGKDSRLVAAVLVSAGMRPHLITRDDNPAETETATRLVELVRDRQGIDLPHEITAPASKAQVAVTGLAERARRLLVRYDFGYGTSYLMRPAVGATWPAALGAPIIGGAMGEIATPRWIPPSWPDDGGGVGAAELRAALAATFASEVLPEWQTSATRRRLAFAIDEIVDHAGALGLDSVGAVHLAYLAERMRVWSSLGFHVNQVAPLLTAEFVSSAFAMSLAEKRAHAIHTGLIDRLVPEWAGVPFIRNTAGLAPTAIPRIWDGDGVDVLGSILARPHGPLLDLVDRIAVETAFGRVRAGTGTGKDDSTLRNVVTLATAEDLFDELNAEVRALTQTSPSPPVVVVPTRYRRARRSVAKVLPKSVLGAALRVRERAAPRDDGDRSPAA